MISPQMLSGRRALLRLLLCLLLAPAFGCGDGSPATSYGTLGAESVNGFDAIVAEIKASSDDVIEGAYLTRRMRREADVIVYLERDPDESPQYYLYMEAWLQRSSVAEMKKRARNPEQFEDAAEDSPDEESVEPGDDEQQSPEDEEESEIAEEAPVAPDSSADGDDATDQDEDQGDVMADERTKTVLYFVRDTDATAPMWELLHSQMGQTEPQAAYCQLRQELAMQFRSEHDRQSVPFNTTRMIDEFGRSAAPGSYSEDIFSAAPPPWPQHVGPSGVPALHVTGEALLAHSVLADAHGRPLIREFHFEQAQLLLIYNTEPFLNFWMVHKQNRRMARDLIRYASRAALREGRKPVAAIVRSGLTPVHRAAENEIGLLRFLTVYPLNLIFIHFAALLLLYLISRWPHKQRPLENPSAGRREFMEHIRALGARLSRTRDRRSALEPLLLYRKRHFNQDLKPLADSLFGPLPEAKTASTSEPNQNTNAATAPAEKNPYV